MLTSDHRILHKTSEQLMTVKIVFDAEPKTILEIV